jgi:hypothetical protein
MPTLRHIVLIRDPYPGVFNSGTANLSSPQVPTAYLLWLLLKNIHDQAHVSETRPVSIEPEPETGAADYNASRLSIGALSNTDVSDDSPNAALQALLSRVLGERAANRFSELSRIRYGWDFGRGESLHQAALGNLIALLSHTVTSPPNPKLFLSADGSLEMRWQSPLQGRISVFIKDDRFEIFKADAQEDSVFMASEVGDTLRAAGLLE